MTAQRIHWRPLIDGSTAARAREAIAAIAEAVAPARFTDPTLASGACGAALLFRYLDQAQPRPQLAALARRQLDDAIDLVAESELATGLYHGLSGVGWTLQHLDGPAAGDDGADDPNEQLDPILIDSLHRRWPDYDLVIGVVGLGVYALERAHLPSGMECLALVVERLRETAVPRGAGLSWWTPPERLPAHQRARHPRGHYNLGAAHGVPGVIAILAAAVERGLPARDLLDGAVAWMLTQEIAGKSGLVFPFADADAVVPTPTRAAWCYGDPGVAVTLLGAARAVGNRDWEQRALAIARRAAARSLAEPDVADAGLCHGAAGLAHLFNRIYQATDDALLGEAARTWFERTLAMRRPGCGPAGYRAYEPDNAETPWIDDLSLFTGVTGIALALLAATSAVPPRWDSLLLASFPSAVRGER